jgi:hypothetical protein
MQGASAFNQNRQADLTCMRYASLIIFWATGKLLGINPEFQLDFITRDLTNNSEQKLLSTLTEVGLRTQISYCKSFIATFNVANAINPFVSEDVKTFFTAKEFLLYKDLSDTEKARLLYNYLWAIVNNKTDLRTEIPPINMSAFLIHINTLFIKYHEESKINVNVEKIKTDSSILMSTILTELTSSESGKRKYLNELIQLANELTSLVIDFTIDDKIIDKYNTNFLLDQPINMIELLNKIGISHFIVYR